MESEKITYRKHCLPNTF